MFGGFESGVFVVWGVLGFFMYLLVFFFLNMGRREVFLGLISGELGYILFPSFGLLVILMWMILMMNLSGLVPYGFSVSALPMVTLFLGFFFWLYNFFWIFKNDVFKVLASFLPVGTPLFLVVILVWIEVVSWLARPIALGVRLMANITAGHLLLMLFSEGVFGSGFLFLLSFSFFLLFVVLEIAVAWIQSYVFSLLLSLYVG
uniref:ATP synthase subunit a n=1 Tax=Rhodosoma turcicum TaxID=1256665 RepID=S0DGA0_9ASCI|nr:ATP synthase F0 subunit 6 [Rhodosoma turcicum]CCO25802.1 ATPase subunit 6 [Rhodosoma turcicum]